MVKIKDKSKISDWWASNPMTYSSGQHGITKFKEGDKEIIVEIGSRKFFEKADEVFTLWNKALHINNIPFNKIFPFQEHKNKQILEIGCGIGFMSMIWAKQGAKVTAIDLNPVAVEQTKKRFELFNLEGKIQQEDANNLSFDHNTFDYVYSWGVLHHSPNFELSISEFFRVLKPGGKFGMMLYNRNSFLHYYDTLFVEGWLHNEREFLNPLQLASRYGDGRAQEGNPHTWPVTKKELRNILSPYTSTLKFKLLGSELDAVFKCMIPGLHLIIPKIIRKTWARRMGWSIWVSGQKKNKV